MDTTLEILAFIGTVETVALLIGLIWATILWVRGISPVLLRLGNGLSKRTIAVFASSDNAASLSHLLGDSGLFRDRNIISVTNAGDLGRAQDASVYLVYWPDWAGDMGGILSQKPDGCAMIVYAPYDMGRIPDEQMKLLDGKRNVAVTNFRGRLLNDIVTSMITTRYGR